MALAAPPMAPRETAQPFRNGPGVTGPAAAEAAGGEALYMFAEQALEAGDPIRAQRHFEKLVADHPDTPYADAARTKLARIYAARAIGAPDRPSGLGVAPSLGAPIQRDGWHATVQPVEPDDKVTTSAFRADASDRVFFAKGSASLGARARAVLAEQAKWLRDNPTVLATIEGHADDPGDADENAGLALRRAEAVREALTSQGVTASRVMASSRGCQEPVAACAEPTCAAQNRRVVTRVRQSGLPPATLPTAPSKVEGIPQPR